MSFRISVGVLMFCLLAVVPAAGLPGAIGETCSATDAGKVTGVLAVRAQGAVRDTGGYQLTVEPGRLATRAVRIYSEPSHTLMLLLSDAEFSDSAEGSQWRSAIEERALAAMVTSLPTGEVRINLPARPPSDDQIAVWIHGTWPCP